MGLATALVLALAGIVAIVGYVQGAERRAQAGEKLVKVLVVQDTVPAGTPAKELGDRVKLEEVSRKVMADGAVSSVKTLDDKVAGTTLISGEQLIESRFVEPSSFSATGADVQVPPGLVRTAVALDPARVIGGVLTPGARVAVTASIDGSSGPDSGVTRTILHKVLVTNVQLTGTVNSTDDTSENKTASSSKPGEAPTSQLLVTLALDPAASQRVVWTQEFGHIWLSIEPNDVSDAPTEVVTGETVLR